MHGMTHMADGRAGARRKGGTCRLKTKTTPPIYSLKCTRLLLKHNSRRRRRTIARTVNAARAAMQQPGAARRILQPQVHLTPPDPSPGPSLLLRSLPSLFRPTTRCPPLLISSPRASSPATTLSSFSTTPAAMATRSVSFGPHASTLYVASSRVETT